MSVATSAKGFHQSSSSPNAGPDGRVGVCGCVEPLGCLEKSLGVRGNCNTPYSVGV